MSCISHTQVVERRTSVESLLCAAFVTRKEVPQKEGKKRITMGTELLLTGLLILFMLGLLVALVYSMVIMLHAHAQDTPGQQRFLLAGSMMNILTLPE